MAKTTHLTWINVLNSTGIFSKGVFREANETFSRFFLVLGNYRTDPGCRLQRWRRLRLWVRTNLECGSFEFGANPGQGSRCDRGSVRLCRGRYLQNMPRRY